MNNMLIGVTTSTLSSWGIKFATPYEQYVDWGNNINFIFMKGSKFATPYEQYVDWGNNINFIFMRDQNSPPPHEQYVDWGNNINFIFMRDQNSPPPMNNMLLIGVININFIFIATWSQTRRNVRVAAN